MNEPIDIYVDGSIKNGEALWGLVVVEGDVMIYSSSGRLSGEINEMRQIGGELKAAMEAVRYARTNRIKVRIFHDYNGIFNWVADGWGGKAWQCNNEWTQKYREFILKNKEWIHSFVKVKGHSGNKWNEKADEVAGNA